jgi:hypothetical protein
VTSKGKKSSAGSEVKANRMGLGADTEG